MPLHTYFLRFLTVLFLGILIVSISSYRQKTVYRGQCQKTDNPPVQSFSSRSKLECSAQILQNFGQQSGRRGVYFDSQSKICFIYVRGLVPPDRQKLAYCKMLTFKGMNRCRYHVIATRKGQNGPAHECYEKYIYQGRIVRRLKVIEMKHAKTCGMSMLFLQTISDVWRIKDQAINHQYCYGKRLRSIHLTGCTPKNIRAKGDQIMEFTRSTTKGYVCGHVKIHAKQTYLLKDLCQPRGKGWMVEPYKLVPTGNNKNPKCKEI